MSLALAAGAWEGVRVGVGAEQCGAGIMVGRRAARLGGHVATRSFSSQGRNQGVQATAMGTRRQGMGGGGGRGKGGRRRF